jgi:Outer membrane protein beta-barrel domain
MKKIVALLLAFGFMSQLKAQNFIGFRGGISGSTVTKFPLIENITPDFKLHPAPNGAIFYELGITEHFAFQPEVVFTQKGFRVNESFDTNSDFLGVNIPIGGQIDLRTNYIEVPLLAKFKMGNAKKAHYYFMVGPSVGYLADAGVTLRVFNIFPIRTSIGNSFFKLLEVSGIAALGFDLPVSKKITVSLETRYQHGLSRILDVPVVQLPVRNQTFGMNLGMKIALDKKAENKIM